MSTLDLELPSGINLPAEVTRALNDKLLRVAEELQKLGTVQTAAVQPTKLASTLGGTAQIPGTLAGQSSSVPPLSDFASGPRASLPSAGIGDALYFATDLGVLYASNGSTWSYIAGVATSTQAGLATLAGELAALDANLLVWVSDYAHMLQWTGSAWQRGPGDPEHSDTFWAFGGAPTDTGWHACDGSTVNYLKYDGTLGSRTIPNADGTACYAKLGNSYSATITAAVAPTFAGISDTTSAVSAGTPAGTISTPTFTGNALPSHFHGSPLTEIAGVLYHTPTGNSFGGSFAYDYDVALSVATGNISIEGTTNEHGSALTPSGTISTPTFTGNALATHTHTVTPTGTISLAGGDPIAWFEAIAYYRQ